ncbi:MAG: lysozyme inhibitor LprI family protein [Steroidobacteraceae bacterium]
MSSMQRLFAPLLPLILLSAPLHAQAPPPDCAAPQTRDALSRCAARELRESDARINVLYSALMKKIDASARQSLRSSQRDWIRDRDVHCYVSSSETDRERWYMSVAQDPRVASCVTDETRYRIATLEAMNEGRPPPTRAEFLQSRTAVSQMATTIPDSQGNPRMPTRHIEGKWYFEVAVDRQAVAQQGPLDVMAGFATGEEFIGTMHRIRVSDRGPLIIGCAIDLDNGMVYIRENGSWKGKDPGSNLGAAVKLGREYSAQVRGSERIDLLLASGAIKANFGGTPFVYPAPDGYNSWR